MGAGTRVIGSLVVAGIVLLVVGVCVGLYVSPDVVALSVGGNVGIYEGVLSAPTDVVLFVGECVWSLVDAGESVG